MLHSCEINFVTRLGVQLKSSVIVNWCSSNSLVLNFDFLVMFLGCVNKRNLRESMPEHSILFDKRKLLTKCPSDERTCRNICRKTACRINCTNKKFNLVKYKLCIVYTSCSYFAHDLSLMWPILVHIMIMNASTTNTITTKPNLYVTNRATSITRIYIAT